MADELKRKTFLLAGLLLLSTGVLFSSSGSEAPKDSAQKKPKEVRRYIRPEVYFNFYQTAEKDLKNQREPLGTKLKSYYFSEVSSGFYVPLYTSTWFRKDSLHMANFHFLLTGHFLSATPHFKGLSEQHTLTKGTLGLRGIYNTGYGNIWFYDVTPFFSQDNFALGPPTFRVASTLIFNRTVNKNFSFRLGFTRTFLFGNQYHLPFIGLRFGPLDGTYLSIQIPRNISLNFPIGKKFSGSLFVKPLGGLYNFSNTRIDSVTNFYNGKDSVIQFGRYEFISGIRLEWYPTSNITLYASIGTTTSNGIAFFSFSYNKDGIASALTQFYGSRIDNRGFVNFGLSVRFGKARKVFNDYAMYDVFDLNHTIDPGDNNDAPGNGDIRRLKNEVKKIQYKDVEDLIKEDDFN